MDRDIEQVELPRGVATPAAKQEHVDDGYPAAVLWLPNPECWRGWEMRRVDRGPDPRPPRTAGFRR